MQEAVRDKGIKITFNEWDGIDDSIKDQNLKWKEMAPLVAMAASEIDVVGATEEGGDRECKRSSAS